MVHWCVKHPRHITSSIDPSSDSKYGLDLQRATDRTQNNNYTVISYNLEQNRWESCTPPPLPQNQGCENGAFWLLRGFIMGAWFGGHGGLLFHFILSKIVGWTGCIKLNWRPRLLQTKARGPHVLIRKTPCSNRKRSCSIYMTTDPGDWPHPSGSNIGNSTCTVNCIWRTPSLKGHKTNTHSWSLQSYRLLWLSLKADTSLRRRERYSSSHFESVDKILWCEHSYETSSAIPFT